MNDISKAKIEKFMADTAMSNAVYDVLLEAFLRPMTSKDDVNVIAASRLAIDFLKAGWKDLERFQSSSEQESTKSGNVGL